MFEGVEGFSVAVCGSVLVYELVGKGILVGRVEGEAQLAKEAYAEDVRRDGGGGGARRGSEEIAGADLRRVNEVGGVKEVAREVGGGEKGEPVVVVDGTHVRMLERSEQVGRQGEEGGNGLIGGSVGWREARWMVSVLWAS